MVNTILFPSSYFDNKIVDEDLQAEYEAVLRTGLFDVMVFYYDDWFNKGNLILSRRPASPVKTVYRGWMMKPEQYREFYNLLLENNIELVTTPEEYSLMHVFPNVYEYVKEDTPKMAIYPLRTELPCDAIKRDFSRFMIKDYVKSVKGTDFPRYFDENTTQEELDKWMDVFYKYRGSLLTGGICVKEYVDLKKYGERTNEYRVFYINHEVATVSRNSGQGTFTSEPPMDLIERYKNLPSVYYTIDFAELNDGTWKILEAGDGSVSGLSDNQNYDAYFRCLHTCFL